MAPGLICRRPLTPSVSLTPLFKLRKPRYHSTELTAEEPTQAVSALPSAASPESRALELRSPGALPSDNRGGCLSALIGNSVIPSGDDTSGASVTLEPGVSVNGAGEYPPVLVLISCFERRGMRRCQDWSCLWESTGFEHILTPFISFQCASSFHNELFSYFFNLISFYAISVAYFNHYGLFS